ncbi:embryonic polyadenylate-binding protein 2 [Lutra lutra]|uniref:embryonic polyadenylate-binding protein 2 n=1 Tax=Lutra lutra TaxID=9657 RepID=UPI001FD51075|nr:embryonic polyadenylate-binding protein 2 [Lutra lutra]
MPVSSHPWSDPEQSKQGRPPAATHTACCRSSLFPPPTEAWLQSLSRDPEAQGWGAWKPPLGSGDGDRREDEPGEAEEDEEDEKGVSLLSLWGGEDLAERPMPDQELEAVKLKLWAMEQTQGPETPGTRGPQCLFPKEREVSHEREVPALSTCLEPPACSETPILRPLSVGCLCPGTPMEKVELDHRSVYASNVDYGSTAEELVAYFSPREEVHRITILCAKFSGHPKGCCPKGPVCRGSAPRTAGASEDSRAREEGSSRAAASGAGPASDREGGTGGRGPGWGGAWAVETPSVVSAVRKGGCGFECSRGLRLSRGTQVAVQSCRGMNHIPPQIRLEESALLTPGFLTLASGTWGYRSLAHAHLCTHEKAPLRVGCSGGLDPALDMEACHTSRQVSLWSTGPPQVSLHLCQLPLRRQQL